MSSQFDAIIPAGGCLTGQDIEKAGLLVGRKTLIETVYDALRESGNVRRIVVIGHEYDKADKNLEARESGPANIYAGLEWLMAQENPPQKVLIATCDLPFVSGQSVRDFLALCPPEAALALPIIRKESFNTRFPGTSSTFVRLREGSFTLGGMFVLDADALLKARPHIEKVFAARKSKLQMAKLFGPVILLKFLLGKLNLAEVEATAQRIIGCSARAIPDAPAELAFDVDDEEELEYARKTLDAK